MQNSDSTRFTAATSALLLTAVLGCYLYLLTAPGTADIPDYWLRWVELMRRHGMIDGYRLAHSDYPPSSFVALYVISRTASAFALGDFLVLKIALALSVLVGAGVFWLWSRNIWHTVAFLFSFLLSSVGHGYLDALWMPPLLLALFALTRGHMLMAGSCLSIAISFKWQPVLVAPFIVIQVVRRAIDVGRVGGRTRAADPIVRFLLGTSFVVLPALGFFGLPSIQASWDAAVSHPGLSYQALNPNWIVQLLIYKYRGLSEIPYFEMLPPHQAVSAAKTAFYVTYAFLLVRCWSKGRTIEDVLWYAVVGATVHYALNVGVHENHLVLAMVVAFTLFCVRSPVALPTAAFCGISANVNLLLFYGLDGGHAFRPPTFDIITVIFSVLNGAFLLVCLWRAGRAGVQREVT